MITQDFNIKKNGVVRGGRISYQADPVTGAVSYQLTIQKPWPLGSITHSSQDDGGPFTVNDTSDFLSATIQKVGQTLSMKNVLFTVMKLEPGKSAEVGVQVFGQHANGTAELDLTGEFLRIESFVASVQAGPLNATVEGVSAN